MTMSEYTVTMSFSGVRSRILMTAGTDEILRAVLPPPRQVRHTRAALSLLEALALWLDCSPRVVVSAADLDATSLFGLTDDFGTPQRGVYYHVEVVEPKPRRRSTRLAGVGEFRDLRQLSLIPGGRP
jgi:hypothetical protein